MSGSAKNGKLKPLFGTVDEIAEQADTIGYEILTGLSPRLPRIWKGLDGQ